MSNWKLNRARSARRAILRLEALESREVLDGSMKFDFGALPPPADFTQVTSTTTYNATRGYGWQSGAVTTGDRHSVTPAGTFAADVANGNYLVTLTLGDPLTARDQVAVSLEGQQRDVLSTDAGRLLTRAYSITVSDGQLNLGLDDLGGTDVGCAIQRLELTPAVGVAGPVQVIDDGDAGFSTAGAWDRYAGSFGHGSDFAYTLSGAGTDVATWTFAVAPGQYKVAATWVARPNRATDAPYAVLDGATAVSTVAVDQRQEPADFSEGGTAWKNLGTVSITGTSLVVKLSDAANSEYVIADAVRIERVDAPEIQVQEGTTDVADGTGSVAFGSVAVGSPASKTFTVRNLGTATLTLGPSITVPAGFSVSTGFGSTTLAPGASTTFTVRLDAAAAGNYSGELSFATNDPNEAPFNFTVSGSVTATPPAAVQVIDNGDAGFSTAGAWDSYTGTGNGNDFAYSPSGTGADVASWTFAVTPGQYKVAATWVARPNRATDAPYAVLDGATAVSTVAVDQRQEPADFSEGGTAWKNLGTVAVAGNTLVVRLSDAAGPEYVIADAVRIERVGDAVPAPAAPAGLKARTLSTSDVRLTWSAAASTAFKVERSLTGTDGWATVATTAVGASSYTDTGLQGGTTYHYRVRATNQGADSPPSAAAQARTFERVVYVTNSAEMQAALRAATAGTAVLMRPGVYAAENHFGNIQGAAGRTIVLAAADPTNRPIIRGGGEGLKFTDAAYLELWDIVLEGQTGNGINIDDGGTYDTPSHHLTLRGLTIRDVDPSGNNDGIKMTGVDHFLIQDCTIAGWGGSGIDMMGCHDGVIERSHFDGRGMGAHGLEAKAGSERIVIRDSRFVHAGDRAIQIGGHSGLHQFRPQPYAPYEAKDVTAEGNVIIGAEAAIAFVNVDGSTVRYNTIYRPRGYVIRILQETWAEGIVPTRNGVFTDNIVAFHSGDVGLFVDASRGTAPETFQFARNWWYNITNPSASTPSLPAPETGGTYGIDPQFVDATAGDFHLRPGSPAANVGAYAPRR